MGCCHSNPSSDDARGLAAPATGEQGTIAHSSSQAVITQPSRGASFSNDASRRTSSISHRQPPAPAGAHRPNRPIRPPSPLRTSPAHVSRCPPPWSRVQLEHERAAFFDTRVAGRPEVWSALRLVCEVLRQGDVLEAQGILDALDVSCPNGRVAIERGRDRVRGGLYDDRGEPYELPAWVVSDPEDIVEGEEKELDGEEGGEAGIGSTGEPGAAARELRRDEKGKGRAADLGDIVQVRARLSDRGTDVVVSVGTKERVAIIVTKIREQLGLKRVRLVYLGHVLAEADTLESQNYRPGDVLNAYVFEGEEAMLGKGRSR